MLLEGNIRKKHNIKEKNMLYESKHRINAIGNTSNIEQIASYIITQAKINNDSYIN